MANGGGSRVDELSSIPFGDLIHSVAVAVADGQFQLDKSSMRVAEFLGGNALLRDIDTGQLLTPDGAVSQEPHSVDTRIYFGYTYDETTGKRQANLVSMMELGFVPTFYQFVDTVIELKIAVRLQRSSASDTSAINDAGRSSASPAKSRARKADRAVVRATPVDARYSATYNYAADLTSKLSTKLVAVPPPLMLQDRIRALLEQETAHREREFRERGLSPQSLGGPVDETAIYRVDDAAQIAQRLGRAFTVEAWVAPQAFRERDGFVGMFADEDSGPKGWLLGVFDGKVGLFLSTVDASTGTLIKAADDHDPGKWHHVAGVYDGADMRLYVDGDLRNGSIEQSGAVAYPAGASLTIGGYMYSEGTVPFAGRIDEVRLWDDALDDSRIKREMNLRLKGSEPGLLGYWRFDKARPDAALEAIGGRDAGQRIAAKRVLAAFREPKGSLFSVKAAPLRCEAVDLKDRSFTIEFWANRKSIEDQDYAVAVSQGGPSSGLYCAFTRSNQFRFSVSTEDLDTKETYVQTGEWHHWACVYDHEQHTRVVYRDGKEVARDTPSHAYSGSGELVIGAGTDDSDSFNGEIAEVRIWNVARSVQQIRRARNLHLDPGAKNLLLYRSLDAENLA